MVSFTTAMPTSTTESLGEDANQLSMDIQAMTTDLAPDHLPMFEIDIKTIINITISTTSLVVSCVAVLICAIAVCMQKRGNKRSKLTRNELPNLELNTTYTNSICTFSSYASPVYDPYSSEKKEDFPGTHV